MVSSFLHSWNSADVWLVRDGWEAKKGELESQMETLLGGVKWTMTCNPLAIFPYGEPGDYGHDSLGNCIFAFVPSYL